MMTYAKELTEYCVNNNINLNVLSDLVDLDYYTYKSVFDISDLEFEINNFIEYYSITSSTEIVFCAKFEDLYFNTKFIICTSSLAEQKFLKILKLRAFI